MSSVVDSIRAEFDRYKTLAERSFEQLRDEELSQTGPGGGNSIAIICWHVAGNLRSRFTDFQTADGEKPWRKRDEEFEPRAVTRTELLAKWEGGWRALREALSSLTDADLGRTVTIRSQPHTVHEALHRALAHISYHVGQIVYLAKSFRGPEWKTLSIPLGASEAVNERMRAQTKRP
ncbi:MAG: DUF1572 family protein [Acidobacteria bacterium]|nr:DUF1572 family protein [Acidobacteriota bacterium]